MAGGSLFDELVEVEYVRRGDAALSSDRKATVIGM